MTFKSRKFYPDSLYYHQLASRRLFCQEYTQNHGSILNGNSEIGAHVRSSLCYLIGLRLVIRPKAVTNRFFLSSNRTIFLHACATCSELPSKKSTLRKCKDNYVVISERRRLVSVRRFLHCNSKALPRRMMRFFAGEINPRCIGNKNAIF